MIITILWLICGVIFGPSLCNEGRDDDARSL